MRKIIRFTLLCILTIILSITLFGETDKSSAGKAESITFMVDGTFLYPQNGEDIIKQAYKDLTGVELIINHPIHNDYYPKLELAFTTGDIPDVFVLGALQYVQYAKQGALYDVTDFYAKSKMKNNMKNQDFVDSCRIEGKLYGVPTGRGNGTLTYIRMDWLEKLGMKPPVNYAEFLDMLRAFKNKNPDGLPPDKVIPITAAGLANTEFPMDIYFREFYQDATPDYFRKNGKWVDGMLEPNMKGALTRMREAYAEGLIDLEIITNKTSSCREKFFTGVVGVFNYWAGYWNDRIQMGVEPNVPHAKVRGIPAIKETFYVERPTGAVGMSAKVKNPQLIWEKWFELLNDMGPGQQLFCFGVEGKTYKVVDGVIDFLPQIETPTQPYSKVWQDPALVITRYAPKYVKLPLIDPSFEIFDKYRRQYDLPSISEELGKLQKEINEIKRNIIAKVVFGELTVDAGIQKYASDIKKFNDIVLPDMNQ